MGVKLENKLRLWLDSNAINYVYHSHEAVFTVDQAKLVTGHIPGLHCKNLFLVYSKDHLFYLVTLPALKSIKILELSKKLSLKKLSFAKPEDLMKILNLEPGSVSPLGLLNDTENKVTYIIDREVWDSSSVCFHPNVNTATLEISKVDFHHLVELTGNKFIILDL